MIETSQLGLWGVPPKYICHDFVSFLYFVSMHKFKNRMADFDDAIRQIIVVIDRIR